MLKITLKTQGSFVALGLLLIGGWGSGLPLTSFFLGSLLATVQLVVMVWSWQKILAKKSIALVGTVIVFKYAFLAILIFRLLSQHWVLPLWFLVGLGTMIPSILVGGFLEMKVPTGSAEVTR